MSRGYACIGLHMAKTPENICHVLRAAACFDLASVNVILYDRAAKRNEWPGIMRPEMAVR